MEHVLTTSVDSTAAVCLDSKGIDAKQVFVCCCCCCFFFNLFPFVNIIKMWQNSLNAASTTAARSSIFKVYEASLEVLLSKDTEQITASIKNANVPLLKESIENWPQNTSNLTGSVAAPELRTCSFARSFDKQNIPVAIRRNNFYPR